MFQWILCTLFLLSEMFVCAAILLPLPAKYRKTLLNKFENFWLHYPRARIVTKTFLSVIALFFADAIRILYIMTNVVADPINPAKPDELRIKLYEAQRNAFLCGFSLFLYVMLHRFESLIMDLAKLEKRQADRSGNAEFNEEQIEKLKQERAVLVARAQECGIDTSVYLEDNTITEPVTAPTPVESYERVNTNGDVTMRHAKVM
eukprot:Phypoly_transcript_18254.p1 GENE.Phypoly_transcript_18254~~Phypoly_transcript_18254.p1  ORF type:complete len:204 (+),score=25.04 Phypoly_transcript_18254:125-736(+)